MPESTADHTVVLQNGEEIERVTRVAEAGQYLHVHTPGGGYRVVDPADIDPLRTTAPLPEVPA